MSYKSELYDNAYCTNEISYESPSGLIGFLYRKLARFEISRSIIALEFLRQEKGAWLDVGCGSGELLFLGYRRFQYCCGIDLSPQRIEQAKRKAIELSCESRVRFQSCDVDEGLPFEDSAFDVVSLIAVLEHVFNPPKVLQGIKRILKPGGSLLVQVPNFAWASHRLELMTGKLPTTGGVYKGADWEHLHNFTKTTLWTLLYSEGFEVTGVTCSGIFANQRKRWLSVLAGDLFVRARKK